jgi:hypothetical protein
VLELKAEEEKEEHDVEVEDRVVSDVDGLRRDGTRTQLGELKKSWFPSVRSRAN